MDRAEYLKLLEPAIVMVAKKGQDYNNAIQLHEYFPFADASYQQMIHLKTFRMRSSLNKGSAPNYDSIKDSVYDLINYAVFYLAYLETLKEAP